MITLPELPSGYRWKYFYSRMDSISKLRLQKKVLGLFWWPVDTEWVHPDIYGGEQKALDNEADQMLRSLKRQLETKQERHYGIYEGGKNGD